MTLQQMRKTSLLMNKYRVTDITIGYLEAESFCIPILAPNYLPRQTIAWPIETIEDPRAS